MDNDDPKKIYLAPRCHTHNDEGRTWCEDDNNWECECDRHPHRPVEYVRADIVEDLTDLLTEIQMELNELKAKHGL